MQVQQILTTLKYKKNFAILKKLDKEQLNQLDFLKQIFQLAYELSQNNKNYHLISLYFEIFSQISGRNQKYFLYKSFKNGICDCIAQQIFLEYFDSEIYINNNLNDFEEFNLSLQTDISQFCEKLNLLDELKIFYEKIFQKNFCKLILEYFLEKKGNEALFLMKYISQFKLEILQYLDFDKLEIQERFNKLCKQLNIIKP